MKKSRIATNPLLCCGTALGACIIALTSCSPTVEVSPGTPVPRHGDEIVVAGQMFRTGTPVVLWMDPGGYDAYRVERRFSPIQDSHWASSLRDVRRLRTPNRYDIRSNNLTEEQLEKVRGGGWDLNLLRQVVDQFVIHYDAEGTSQRCFYVLHDRRGLSVHFLLDLDGTIYQTLDLKERAWHTRDVNDRSIGIEIASIGAHGEANDGSLNQWYTNEPDGRVRITVPEHVGDGWIRTPDFVARPARNDAIEGDINEKTLRQYDFSMEQYEALVKLTATLSEIFPKIKLDYPRDENGNPIAYTLSNDEIAEFQGLIGHYHLQADKVDPGPAFDWDYVVDNARKLLGKR